jgi:hypothetical protein
MRKSYQSYRDHRAARERRSNRAGGLCLAAMLLGFGGFLACVAVYGAFNPSPVFSDGEAARQAMTYAGAAALGLACMFGGAFAVWAVRP